MRRTLVGLGLVGAAFLASAASAHDFFLLPVQFNDDANGPVAIQATVGSSFPKPETVVEAVRVDQLIAIGNGAPKVRVAGAGPTSLNLEVDGARAGLLVTGVGTKPRDVDYAEDRIPLILGEYRVLPQAAAAVGALPRPRTWRVVSRRFAKTFLCVASCADRSAAERSFGAHLEFVGSRASADRFRLLAHGKPLANYPVDLVGSDGKRRHLTTDAKGSIHVAKDDRGAMMLFAAKLEPPAEAGRFALDLTSLTFRR